MPYIKQRGTKTNCKRIPRAQGTRLSCTEATRSAIFLVKRKKRKPASLKRDWDVRKRRVKGTRNTDGSTSFIG